MPARTRLIRFLIASVAVLGFSAIPFAEVLAGSAKPLVYPKARKGDVVDNYHGVKVPDPYRWLEDEHSPETRTWIEAQNRITLPYLERIPERAKIKKRLTHLWDYEKYGMPWNRGGRYFFTKNEGLQNHSVLYTVESLDGQPRMLLDPNSFSADGTTSLSGLAATDDGKLMAYAKSAEGSDWDEWFVRDVETGKDLGDHLMWIKFSGASWTKDKKGFYYSRYDEPKEGQELQQANYYNKLCYHRLGTPQSADTLIYERPDQKEWSFGGKVTDDGRYLIISVRKGTERNNLIFFKDLKQEDSNVVEMIRQFDAQYSFIDNDGPLFWFKTDLDAPLSRVIAIDTRKPDRANWKEVIPQARETLRRVNLVGNKFVTTYLKDAHTQVKMFDVNGKFVREVAFPSMGTAYGFGGKRHETETFYTFTGFTDPGTIYRYDMVTGKSGIFRRPKVDFNPDEYETRQVFYKSKDGTKVPMFITYKKGIKLDGNRPTLLYGYGGFNASMTPYFSVSNLVWMEMGGVYAVANIRGGGEYGKKWHEAGMKLEKQNCFDDFIAAAEWLIDNKYTSARKLAIRGASNGGLLVGACMTQRPDLFGACVPAVGVMDMLRFNKYTIGWAWVSDYGSPENREEFEAMYAYSPLHNLKPGTAYPATLITTADHDDRVVPAHSFKFAAALQEAHSGPAPVLIRVQTKAGHGAGKPTKMRIQEATDIWAFLVHVLDMDGIE